MVEQFTAPKGTYDVLPEQQPVRGWVIATAEAVFARYGYRRIDTPAFEDTHLFHRGVGDSTDIVRKEMYTFEDLGGRSMTLRPEGTAPVCRAYVEHGMHTWPQPVKLYYYCPMFRYESPQSGRYRQHYQLGVEAFG
jgi:histidyl-tRNA synthetase